MPLAPLSPRVIAVPRVTPIQTGGPTSFSGVLRMEKSVDAWFASGTLARFEVPRASVPARLLKPGFEDAKTYKIPLSEIFGAKQKGSVYAVRLEQPGQDHFTLYTPSGTRLAVRQLQGAGSYWANYRIK